MSDFILKFKGANGRIETRPGRDCTAVFTCYTLDSLDRKVPLDLTNFTLNATIILPDATVLAPALIPTAPAPTNGQIYIKLPHSFVTLANSGSKLSLRATDPDNNIYDVAFAVIVIEGDPV